MQVITINGQIRKDLGKKGAKAVRDQEQIPCVLYGGDEVVHFSTTPADVRHLIYSADFKIAEVVVDGKPFKCILKDKQFHPVTDAILHLDFLRLVDDQPVKVEVPLRFKGTAAGVKAGGKLLQKLRTVKIKTIPQKLVDEINLDVSHLELGQSVRVRDIAAIEGVEILNSLSIPVATIEIPRALRSAAQAEAAGKK